MDSPLIGVPSSHQVIFVKFRHTFLVLLALFYVGLILLAGLGFLDPEALSIDPLGPAATSILFGLVFAASISSFVYAIGLLQIPAERLYPDVRPVSRSELVERLLSLNDPDKPWEVAVEGSDLVARWKIADAKWWEILKRAGLSIQYIGRMRLVDRSKTVLYLEELAELEWSAGLSDEPFSLRYSKFRGRLLFDKRKAVAFAFRSLKPPDFGKVYEYDFDVNEIRGPIIETVEKAGWLFQPVTRL